MKDLVIKGKRMKTELTLFAVLFLLATGVNVFAIATRGTAWKELYTQLHIVFLLAGFFYVVILAFRLIYCGVRRLTLRKKVAAQ